VFPDLTWLLCTASLPRIDRHHSCIRSYRGRPCVTYIYIVMLPLRANDPISYISVPARDKFLVGIDNPQASEDSLLRKTNFNHITCSRLYRSFHWVHVSRCLILSEGGLGTGIGAGEQCAQYTMKTLLITCTVTVRVCPSTLTDCPARQKTTFATTETLVAGTTVYEVKSTGPYASSNRRQCYQLGLWLRGRKQQCSRSHGD
jgi:hypothetical protein